MNTKDYIAITLSLGAFLFSVVAFWFTAWRRGRVFMTQPTVIYFGIEPEQSSIDSRKHPKVYLRTLLFSSGRRGYVVESLFVRLHRGETTQTFNIWVFGEEKLTRGSGLYVGETGVVSNHHFLLPADGTEFQFLEGEYILEVYANLFSDNHAIRLNETRLQLSGIEAAKIQQGNRGVFFDWSPESRSYRHHVRPSLPQLPQDAA